MADNPFFVAAGTYLASASSTAAPVAVPAGVQVDDVIIVDLYIASTAAVTPPDGSWTELAPNPSPTGTGAHTYRRFWRLATGADTGTYTFTWTGAANREGVATAWRDVFAVFDIGSISTGSTPGVSTGGIATGTVAAQRTIVWGGSSGATGAWTPPAFYTERVDTGGRISVASLVVATATDPLPTIFGSQVSSAHGAWVTFLLPTPTTPIVSAGADIHQVVGEAVARTATTTDDGGSGTITAQGWTVVSGPDQVGDTLSSSAVLAWTPLAAGSYVLRYSQTRAGLTGTDDVTVNAAAGSPFLEGRLAGGQLWVEVAWGADLAADPATWTWTDITDDVREPDGQAIEITVGRADEASETQPAQCTLTLDNATGAYSLGGRSSNWPYVRRNTPIRVRMFCDGLAAPASRFEGYVVGWIPAWDITGRDATVAVTAAGELRRLMQNTAPGVSPYRRATLDAATSQGIVAYWPCEESGVVTGGFSPAIGSAPLRWNTDELPPKPGESDIFLSSHPLPTVEGAELYGAVPRYTAAASPVVSVRMLIAFPESGIPDNQPLLLVDVSGSTNWWIVRYVAGGSLNVRVLNAAGTELETNTTAFDVDGRALLLDFSMAQSGGNVGYSLTTLEQGKRVGGTAGNSVAGTLGVAQAVWVNTFTDRVDDGVAPAEVITPGSGSVAVGHITVASALRSIDTEFTEFSAYDGEYFLDRLIRIADENSIRLTAVIPDASWTDQPADFMGPQVPADTLTLFREIEQVDKGVLVDGREFGLSYYTRRVNESLSGSFELESGHLSSGFAPVDDDQGQANQVTVEIRNGGTVVAEDSAGPLGTAAIGLYADQVTLNVASEEAAIQNAAWYVRRGTVEGYRYPTLGFSLSTFPELVEDWLSRRPGHRVDVADPEELRAWAPGETLSFSLLGYTETLGRRRWDVTLNVAPYAPYRIVEVGASASATNEFTPHLDTLGAELAAPMAAGAAAISVATTSGPIWTTAADAYPMTLDVGGIPVTAVACTGSSSPQTFTLGGLATLSRSGWTVTADSEETSGESAPVSNVLDGDAATYWHTVWSGTPDPLPHTLTVDMHATASVAGLRCLPRVGGGSPEHGRIGQYEVHTSTDGSTWGSPVASGTWTDDASEKTTSFVPVTARYVRLTAVTEAGGRGPWTTAAEINLLGLTGAVTADTAKAAGVAVQVWQPPVLGL